MIKLLRRPYPNDVDVAGFSRQTVWRYGETKSLPPCEHPRLCSPDVFHCYDNIGQAILFMHDHGYSLNSLAYEVTGDVVVSDFDKVGCFWLTLGESVPFPSWTRQELAVVIYKAVVGFELFAWLLRRDGAPETAITRLSEIFYTYMRGGSYPQISEISRIMLDNNVPEAYERLFWMCLDDEYLYTVGTSIATTIEDFDGKDFPLQARAEDAMRFMEELYAQEEAR